VAAAAAAALGGYLYWRGSKPLAPLVPASAPTEASTPFPGPEAFGLPSLDQSDAYVREEARGLTSHPLLGLWLGQQQIVRLVANVVETVSKGDSPRKVLGFLSPQGEFQIAQRPGGAVIARESYARYDFFAEGVASVDTAAAVGLLRRALPLLEAAYRELGYPEGGFTVALRDASVPLLAVPVVEADIAVKPVRRGEVLVYELVDPALEGLSPAQKHLLRMGPANVRRVQSTLRAFLETLGA